MSALNAEVIRLRKAGKYAEAVPLAQRYAEAMKARHGADHPEYATALNNLALVFHHQGRYAEAERLYKTSLRIRETALGHNHSSTATSLNNLAGLYGNLGRYAEAEPLYKRSLRLDEATHGNNHPSVATALNNLGALYQAQSRHREAEDSYRRSLRIRETALGKDHADTGTSVGNLATLYQDLGRYADAEPMYKRALRIGEAALGGEHPLVAASLNNFAGLYEAQGRYADAEPLYQRSLAIREKALGKGHRAVGDSLNNLAGLYNKLGRDVDAERLYERALSVLENALGEHHPNVGTVRNNLGLSYSNHGRHVDAERFLRRGLAIWENAFGPDHPRVAISLNNLATLYTDRGRFADAEPLIRRSLAISEKSLGPDHPSVGDNLNNLAELYRSQGREAEAEIFYGRALTVGEKTVGPDHPAVGRSLQNLALLYFQQGKWQRAAEAWRRSIRIIERRAQTGESASGETLGQTLIGKSHNEATRSRHVFVGLIRALDKLTGEGEAGRVSEAFQAAQQASASEVATSLTQMAVRGAKGNRALSSLVRERQDLIGEWQARDRMRVAQLSLHPDKRSREAEAETAARLGAIESRVSAIDTRMAREFPDYAAFSRPKALSIQEVQAVLQSDEALVQFFDTSAGKHAPEETFVWIVTKSDVRQVRSALGARALAREVAALRCGLDSAGWNGKGESYCRELLNSSFSGEESRAGKPLPFDMARSHRLYKALFGEAEDLIKGKHLLIVPSGALTTLPFHVLITRPLTGDDLRGSDWLVRSHAVTVLPAVASLQALRQTARASIATRPMIGFANPLLTGPDAGFASLAVEAQRRQSCSYGSQAVAPLALRRTGHASPLPTLDGRAELSLIRAQPPLPETADELCAVARAVGADLSDMRLGARASEREVKALSGSGALAKYRIVHFSTHALTAGQLSLGAEPGLILTPPAVGSADDDGYLTASEAAGLKLDADWIILSACNTAAGGAEGAEALSGLASAFFYAGARALLVSHWEVDSQAAVKLVSNAVNTSAIGRAEALRRAMLALIDSDKPHHGHPSSWAPFIVVGEGGGSR